MARARVILRRIGWSLLALVITAAIALLVILNTGPTDDFQFLGGRKPIARGIHPEIQILSGHSNPMMEYRIYSWNGVSSEVLKAEKELENKGFTWDKFGSDEARMFFKGDLTIWMEPRLSLSREDVFRSGEKLRPRGMTVIVSNPAPETWISHIRLAFEPEW